MKLKSVFGGFLLLIPLFITGCVNGNDAIITNALVDQTNSDQGELDGTNHDEAALESEIAATDEGYSLTEENPCFQKMTKKEAGNFLGMLLLFDGFDYWVFDGDELENAEIFFGLEVEKAKVSPNGEKILIANNKNDVNEYEIFDFRKDQLVILPIDEEFFYVDWVNSDTLIMRNPNSEKALMFNIVDLSTEYIELVHPNQIEIDQGDGTRLFEYLLTDGFFINPKQSVGVYHNGHRDHIYFWDSEKNKQITEIDLGFQFLGFPIWHPDGGSVFVVSEIPILEQRDLPLSKISQYNRDIYQVSINGDVTKLTDFETVFPQGNYITTLKISPNGQTIIFDNGENIGEEVILYQYSFFDKKAISTCIQLEYPLDLLPMFWINNTQIILNTLSGQNLDYKILYLDFSMNIFEDISSSFGIESNYSFAGWLNNP